MMQSSDNNEDKALDCNSRNPICFIVGAGDFDGMHIKPIANNNDYVIAADGGYKYLESEGIIPDTVMGDFDSLGFVPSSDNVVKYPVMKDDTDMMIAVKRGLTEGYKNFIIYGGLGGMLDHTIANLDAITYIAQNEGIGYLIGGGKTITAITDSLYFNENYKGRISIFTRNTVSTGIYLRNLLYELTDWTMRAGDPIGVSNEFISKKSSIQVKDGMLIVIYDDDYNSGLPKLV